MSKIQNQIPIRRASSCIWPASISGRRLRLWLLASILPILIVTLGVERAAAQERVQLITYASTLWSYHTNIVDPGYVPADAWTGQTFDDSSWPTGFGIFGYEPTATLYTGPSATFVACECPFNTYITPANTTATACPHCNGGISTYFRTHFNWTNSNTSSVLFTFTNYVDDSIVVYLNGALLFSFNFSATKTYPIAWNDANPSGAANPLGEGVPFATNLFPANLLVGDNVIAVQLQQQAATSSDDVFTLNLWATPPAPIVITQNPTNRTVPENRVLTLGVGITGTAPIFQWYKGTNSPVAITDATNQTYTILNTVVADTGDYFVVVSNTLNTVTSLVAHIAVVTDTNGPVLLSVRGDDTFQKIILTWDETVAQGPAIELGSYLINDPAGAQVFVNSIDYLGNSVVLHVPTLLTDTNYTIEVDYQTDIVGNPTKPVGNPVGDVNGIATNFHTWAISTGSLRFQAYNTGGGNDVSALTGHPSYPGSPDRVEYITAANSRLVYPTDAREGYGATMTGFFVPQVTSNYTFYLSSDDASELWLSTDQTEANKQMLTAEIACCTPFSAHASASIALVAGQAYWFQLLYKEGTGGDYGQAAVKFTADPVSPDSLQPISGALLASVADPAGASVTITQQPASRTFIGSTGPSLFSTDFNANDGGFTVTTPQTYEGPWVYNSGTGSWQQDGQQTENSRPNTSFLDGPPLTVTVAGEVIVSFAHRYSFEHDGTAWDGGQVRVSVNGGAFTAENGTFFSSNSYNSAVAANSGSDLKGQPAFVGTSPGYTAGFITSVASLGTFNAADVVRVRFMAAADTNTRGPNTPNWEIDSVQFVQGSALTTTFSVGASGVNASGTNPPKTYQWFRNAGAGWVPISGANGTSYTFAPQPSDNGTQFRAVVYIPGASATSTPATLSIGAAGPRLTARRNGNNLIITWPASFTTFTLESAATIPSATWTTVSHTVVGGDNTATVPIPASGNAFYRLRE